MADNFTRVLSDARVRNAKPAAKPFKLADGGGLFLLVQPNGAKLWRYKFRLNGTEGLEALGAYPETSLSAARDAHRESRALVASGQHPVRTRQEERQRAERERQAAELGRWDTAVAAWRAKTDPELAPASIGQRAREFKKHLDPKFAGRQLASIRRVELAALLVDVAKRTPEVARNLRGYLEALFEHAINTGLVDANPTPPRSALKRRRSTPQAAMAMDAVGQFLVDVRAYRGDPATAAAMQLVMMTACRKCEVIGAAWDEFDLDAAVWVIPAARMKGRREHWVPLSRQAVALLRELRRLTNGVLVFPNRRDPDRPMAGRTLNAMMERLERDAATVHGFRALFSTHHNALGANPDVVERCLAHAPRDMVRAVYNRHDYQDERRALLQGWADHLEDLSAQSGIRVKAAA